ncbi:MAG: NAD(P)-dependent oxidoreductase [Candidatus Nitrosocaldus sp.]|nr:NAD(P)-dependent oxidoreductase [Candidatus Nitrosocaldus sp.]MCS7141944.1 NAD(P)-dependent oxidoreductase [Candidatus Nitrosocaldus sp.]MDW8000416.1 NAD(P)-dependent oxidoreductase [Candidatus Nitrosocaldus sp.]MDW8276103.1 NAD(P)-dependent oxidoreductase [Candidatus Nitrosocaldus sp.]
MSRVRVGLIGTGMMGSAIARRLLASGYTLTVYNRSRWKAEALKGYGAVVADTPMDAAARSDLLITVLKDEHALEDVLFSSNGVVHARSARGDSDGGAWLTLADVSTINPNASRAIASRLNDHCIAMLDTPVMGGPQLAEQGMLVMMVGGSRERFERFTNVFSTIANRIFYIGGNGSAHTMKLALNLQIAMIAAALSEGILLVERSGLDAMLFLEILNSTYFKTGMSERKGPRMVRGEYEKSFALEMMLKDVKTINDAARALDVSLPMASMLEQLYRLASKTELADRDYTALLEFLRMVNRGSRGKE